jgi:hypothetical protein
MHKHGKGWTACAILNPDSVVKVDYDVQNLDVIRIEFSSWRQEYCETYCQEYCQESRELSRVL